MTAAATTPTTPNRGDWAWPLKPPPSHLMPSPSPPLELQFLPPSAAAASASSPATLLPPTTSWTVDPSRLQKLMMGSVATSASPVATTPTHPAGSRSSLPDFGEFFDPGINKPLPSGWERCLDLKSGEVFIKKCDMITEVTGVSPTQFPHLFSQRNDWKQPCVQSSRTSETLVQQVDEQRPDWSLRWMQGKPMIPTQNLMKNSMSFIKTETKLYGEEERHSSPLDTQPICLDLDLRLTSDNSSRLASEAAVQSSKPILSTVPCSRDASSHSKVQPWKWQQLANGNDRPASIQEMVSQSTMATAVCSKCLMYVLLKKTNPTCPRCFNPIILDSGVQSSSAKKRARLELSPDDLSLSTDSSR